MTKQIELVLYKILAGAGVAGAALVANGAVPAYFAPVFTAATALSMFFHAQASA